MTEADIIRSASSRWLRDNESEARRLIGICALKGILPEPALRRNTLWSAVKINNMLTYLALVGGA